MDKQEIEIRKRIAEIKKRRAEEVAKCDLEIAELDLKLIPIENEELFEEISLEFEREGYQITPTKMGNVIEIEGGILLSATACKNYKSVEYVGNGIIKVGRRKMPFTAPQILLILQDYNHIPKVGIDTRKRWVSEKIGKAKRIDTLLWNYVNGNLTEALQQYMDETPLAYDQGQLVF